MRFQKAVVAPALLCVSFLCGCGGNGGSAAVPAQGQTSPSKSSFGPFSVSSIGTPKAEVSNSSLGPVVTAVAGALFNNVTFSPAHDLATTELAYSARAAVYSSDIHGFTQKLLSPTYSAFGGTTHPTWSKDGRIAFSQTPEGVSGPCIFVMNGDGSGVQRVTTTPNYDIWPTWSPAANIIAFCRYDATNHDQIYVMYSNGASLHSISDGTHDDSQPAFSADGTKIYFRRPTGTGEAIYVMKTDGTGVTLASSAISSSYVLSNPTPSPDGTKLLVTALINGYALMYMLPPDGTQLYTVFPNSTTSDYPSCWAPDSSRFLFRRLSAGGATMMTCDAYGNNLTTLFTLNDTLDGDASWSPFMNPRVWVGTGGTFGSTAAGFIFGEQGQVVTSALVFSATTPSTATAVADAVSTYGDNIVYRVNADSITSMRYINNVFGVPQTIIGPGGAAAAKGALVTFDATTGLVSAVLPYSSKKRPPERAAGSDRGTISYSGEFLGVWDGKAKNLAPKGARQVVIAPKTGQVISVR